jgi:hypothetical protein
MAPLLNLGCVCLMPPPLMSLMLLLLLPPGLCAGDDALGMVSLVLTNTLQEVYLAAFAEKFKGREHQQEVRHKAERLWC